MHKLKHHPRSQFAYANQLTLWAGEAIAENPDYLTRQLITCIGNKRALLGPIGAAVAEIKRRLGKDRLRILDAFSGSGAVARLFKQHASHLVANDIEDYATVVSRCFLHNRSTVDVDEACRIVADLNQQVDVVDLEPGFIEALYAPHDENHITHADRVFYTRRNARRLDNYRRMIETMPADWRDLLIGPLLSEASVHANTAGVFKGFYKDRQTGIGRFGGTNGDALTRILGDIVLEIPVLSHFECDVEVFQEDANAVVRKVRNLDLAYFDPPYNQHPYGANYFMLNLLVRYEKPQRVSKVSGIPVDWRRSPYNVRARALRHFRDLVHNTDARFILVSFNSEGFIAPDEMQHLLGEIGSVTLIEIPYNTFRGSRNLRNRTIHVTEQLFLVESR